MVGNRQTPKYERTARFDGHFPKLKVFAKLRQSLFDKIHFTHGNVSGSDDDIAFFESASQRKPRFFEDVCDNRINPRNGSALPDKHRNTYAVAFINLPGFKWLTGLF